MRRRKTTNRMRPGVAVRQVTTKKFAHPMADTTCPAIAPMVTRGTAAIADSSAYWVALKFGLHWDTRNATNAA